MVVRKILQLGDPRLRRPAHPVEAAAFGTAELRRLVDDLIETMREADGAGLAAPQVGEGLRVAVIEVKENPRYPSFPRIPLTVLVNPVLTPCASSGEPLRGPPAPGDGVALYEGCLSVAGLRGRVRRPRRVRVRAVDVEGRALELDWEGVPAAVVQHECDHLDGVLFVDRADPHTLTFLREYERHVPAALRVVDERSSSASDPATSPQASSPAWKGPGL